MICIVDDDPLVTDATVDLLHSVGHTAVAFASAEAFLASQYANGDGCLILDCHLPGLSGPELQDRLLINNSPVAIIFITAFPDQIDRQHAARAVACLPKPVSETDLIAAIQAALSRK